MGAPNTKDWAAICNKMPPGPENFYVVGQVETVGGNLLPVLKPTVPQGINPTILMLTLTIEDTGNPGTDDVAFRPARYDGGGCGEYTEVTIMWEGTPIGSADVQVVH